MKNEQYRIYEKYIKITKTFDSVVNLLNLIEKLCFIKSKIKSKIAHTMH